MTEANPHGAPPHTDDAHILPLQIETDKSQYTSAYVIFASPPRESSRVADKAAHVYMTSIYPLEN